MNALNYYLGRRRGLDPADAMDEAGDGGDSTPSAPQPPADPTPVQTSAPPPADPSQWQQPDFPSQPPVAPPPPGPPQAPQGLSAQLAAALARGQQRNPMPADIGDDALKQSMEGDEAKADDSRLTETIRAAFARQQPNYAGLKGGPSAGTQALLSRRQQFQQGEQQDRSDALKAAEVLKGEQPKPLDPSLVALHEASAAQLAGLDATRKADEERKKAADSHKLEVDTKTKADEAASLESQRKILAADPRLKRLGLTPDVVLKLDRKGLEDVARELGPRGTAGGGGPSPGHRLSAEALKELAGIDAADKQLADLEAEGAKVGLDSFKNQALGVLPDRLTANTDIGRYKDSALQAMQGVGLILEHGKLAAGDEVKYRRMLPEPGDDATTLHHKVAKLRAYLAELKGRQQQMYAGGGYKVPGAAPSGGHGKVVKETKSVRQYEDGYLEAKGG
jgi:hypothetical protein